MTDQVAIENLTIDEETFSVADLPNELQAAVRKYEEWRDRYILAQDEVQLVAAALRDLGAQIVGGVRASEEQKAAAVAAAAVVKVEEAVEAEASVSSDTLVIEDAAE